MRISHILAAGLLVLLGAAPLSASAATDQTVFFPPLGCSADAPYLSWDGKPGQTRCQSGQDVLQQALANCGKDSQVVYDGTKFSCEAKPCRTDRGYTCSVVGKKDENTLELYTSTSGSNGSPWTVMMHNNYADGVGDRPWGFEAAYDGSFRIGRPGDSSNSTYPFRIEQNGDVEIGHSAALQNNLVYNGVHLCFVNVSGVQVLGACP